MRQDYPATFHGNFDGNGNLMHRTAVQRLPNPAGGVRAQRKPALFHEQHHFPATDGRKMRIGLGRSEDGKRFRGNTLRREQAPEPDMRIEQ